MLPHPTNDSKDKKILYVFTGEFEGQESTESNVTFIPADVFDGQKDFDVLIIENIRDFPIVPEIEATLLCGINPSTYDDVRAFLLGFFPDAVVYAFTEDQLSMVRELYTKWNVTRKGIMWYLQADEAATDSVLSSMGLR